ARCSGHIEAPAEGAGMWIRCPHCGEKTQLVAPPPKVAAPEPHSTGSAKKSSTHGPLLIGLICLVCGAMTFAGVAFFLHTAKKHRASPLPPPITHANAEPKPITPDATPQPDLWNGLKPGPITIEKS